MVYSFTKSEILSLVQYVHVTKTRETQNCKLSYCNSAGRCASDAIHGMAYNFLPSLRPSSIRSNGMRRCLKRAIILCIGAARSVRDFIRPKQMKTWLLGMVVPNVINYSLGRHGHNKEKRKKETWEEGKAQPGNKTILIHHSPMITKTSAKG